MLAPRRLYCYAIVNRENREEVERLIRDHIAGTTARHNVWSGLLVHPGTTASTDWRLRPGCGRIVRQWRPGDCLAVRFLAELSSGTADLVNLLRQIDRDRIRLIAVRDGIDSADPIGHARLQGILDTVEIGKQRKRIARVARMRLAETGQTSAYRVNYPVGYGFNLHSLKGWTVNESQRRWGSRILELRAGGYSDRQISRQLRRERFPLSVATVRAWALGEIRLRLILACTGQPPTPFSADPPGWPGTTSSDPVPF